jgi:peptidoglycan hydrolase CwlO-like protein
MDYTKENIYTMLEVWGTTQSKLSVALGLSQYALAHMLKPEAKNISSILIPLEEISGIPARRLVGEMLGYDDIPKPHYDFRLTKMKATAGTLYINMAQEEIKEYKSAKDEMQEDITYLQARVMRNDGEIEKMKQELLTLQKLVYDLNVQINGRPNPYDRSK